MSGRHASPSVPEQFRDSSVAIAFVSRKAAERAS
jgi:hypothetical protein